MKDLILYIPEYDWRADFHIAATCYHTKEIAEELRECGCPPAVVSRAVGLMDECRLNTGLTWSDKTQRRSVVVVALASSAAEFSNSLQHEIRHLVDHICDEFGIRYGDEEAGYLAGEINLKLFDQIKEFYHERPPCKRR